jgi:hypothetical protein
MTLLVLVGALSADTAGIAAFKPNTDAAAGGVAGFTVPSQRTSRGNEGAGARVGAVGKQYEGNTMHRKAIRYVTQTTSAAAGAVATAATSVAAAAVAASIIFSPVADASSRMEGVSEDLLRAVQLNQITEEQALKFEARLAGRILGDA